MIGITFEASPRVCELLPDGKIRPLSSEERQALRGEGIDFGDLPFLVADDD